MENDKRITTLFDDVHRTMMEYVPDLLIGLINEAFGTDYCTGEELIQLKNEHVSEYWKIITDSLVTLRGKKYHIESQSYPDGTMVIRMVEYDFSVALEGAAWDNGSYLLEFPKSCVIYLRHNRNTPDRLSVQLVLPDGTEAAYTIPVIKAQEYSLEQIFAKKLFFLLPYYMMRYEKRLGKKALQKISRQEGNCSRRHAPHNSQRHKAQYSGHHRNHDAECRRIWQRREEKKVYKEMLADYNKIKLHLMEYLQMPDGAKQYRILMELLNRVTGYVIPEGKDKERMVARMGGKVLQLRAIEEWEAEQRGMERGLKRGQEEGISALVELCQEFGMTLVDTIERVCNAYGITEPESRNSVEKYWKG